MEAQLQGFSAWIDQVRRDWDVPGLAVAIVKDSEIIFCEGSGLRNVKEGLPVTPDTLFAIGSSTKAFTAMSVGMLVDEGKIDWDQPVHNYLPEFQLKDAFASERMTPRDLLCHRSGLPRHDFMWYNSSFSRADILSRLRFLEPNKDFRTTWQYQNLMFLTAGYLAGRVAGTSWETHVQQQILDTLQMTDTNFSVEQSQKAANYALPYSKSKDEVKEIPFRNIDTAGPAGSINSNLRDMAKWVQLHLNRGKCDDRQIISEANLAQMHSAQMVIQQPAKYKEMPYRSYGLGWFVEPYRGRNMIHHGGNIDGFTALVSMMPEEGIGMVILSNLNGTPLPTIVSYQVYDRLLGLDPIDWSARVKDEVDKAKVAVEKSKQETQAQRIADTKPSHPWSDYVGEYEHKGYGALKVFQDEAGLKIHYNSITLALQHQHYDIFNAEQSLFEITFPVSFLTEVKGSIDRLTVQLEPMVDPIEFRRLADKAMAAKEFLQQFMGEYELMGATITVAAKGDKGLILTVPGQPSYELVPYQGTTFNLKGLTGFSVEFKKDDAGKIIAVAFTQPNGVFTANKKQ